jgi:hypothetical protein
MLLVVGITIFVVGLAAVLISWTLKLYTTKACPNCYQEYPDDIVFPIIPGVLVWCPNCSETIAQENLINRQPETESSGNPNRNNNQPASSYFRDDQDPLAPAGLLDTPVTRETKTQTEQQQPMPLTNNQGLTEDDINPLTGKPFNQAPPAQNPVEPSAPTFDQPTVVEHQPQEEIQPPTFDQQGNQESNHPPQFQETGDDSAEIDTDMNEFNDLFQPDQQ